MALNGILMKMIIFSFIAIIVSPTLLVAISMPACPDACGDLKVPYPFGLTESCSLEEKFFINCDKTSNPPSPFLMKGGNLIVTNISLDGELVILPPIAQDCYDNRGFREASSLNEVWVQLLTYYTISHTQNKFTALGCDTYALVEGYRGENRYTTGCVSSCDSIDSFNESCSGIGCCQTSIPQGLKNITVVLRSLYNHTYVLDFNPCSYAFVVEQSKFEFSNSSFDELNNTKRLPMVLDWSIGNVSCDVAQKLENYTCKRNSKCVDSTSGSPGYFCQCLTGYEGNPYLPAGCQDIDECKILDPCIEGICTNIPGSFNCSCMEGYKATNATACVKIDRSNRHRRPVLLYIPLGISMGLVVLLVSTMLFCWGMKRRKLIRLKEKFFEQNGGLMLQQRLSSQKGYHETTKIFASEELQKATNNYHESRIIGEGGYGTVYKGILPGNKVVAVKKSKINGAQLQTEQFINEVIVLMQINHRNVVRLLGCCLETEVPLLVYEYITNGTLFQHIHNKGQLQEQYSSLPWKLRLKIATETAGALAYLHSDTVTPIIHRDVKTANILLDDNYIAKVSDFGTSRLIPLDQDQITTLVQGTLGYLDPEYFHSSQLTEKSDVYSFGVVLAELLTGKKALAFDRPESDRSLAMFFVSSIQNDRLLQIIDDTIVNDGNIEEVKEVANLTKRCLRIKGEERPTMKEVAMELEGLRTMQKHAWGKDDNLYSEETEYLLGIPSVTYSTDVGNSSSITSAGFDSTQRQLILKPYNDGR